MTDMMLLAKEYRAIVWRRSARHDTLVDDDAAGAALVVNHLADLGHRRIAHIEHNENDAVRSVVMPNAIRADGYRQAMQLLGRPNRPTAIFAGADIAAMVVTPPA